MKRSFSVRRSLGVALLPLVVAAFVGTSTQLAAQAEPVKARIEPVSISDLSACNTAAGDRSGEGLSGLARAFFYAGARSLLASHWPVRDDVTAELTVAAIKAHQAGMSRADAL